MPDSSIAFTSAPNKTRFIALVLPSEVAICAASITVVAALDWISAKTPHGYSLYPIRIGTDGIS